MVISETRLGEEKKRKKKEDRRKEGKKLQGKNIMAPLLHRAAITTMYDPIHAFTKYIGDTIILFAKLFKHH